MGELRIIAGLLRRRRIQAPPGRGLRPTADRVREALFDILGPGLEGVRVLDAFAGSGALGLEALSRGARSVTFVERDRGTLAVLRRNVADLGVAGSCRIVPGSVERVLEGCLAEGPFDLVLADPPYDEPVIEPFLRILSDRGVLAERARVVVERDHRVAPSTPGTGSLLLVRTSRYGRTCLDFYRRMDSHEGREPPRELSREWPARDSRAG